MKEEMIEGQKVFDVIKKHIDEYIGRPLTVASIQTIFHLMSVLEDLGFTEEEVSETSLGSNLCILPYGV